MLGDSVQHLRRRPPGGDVPCAWTGLLCSTPGTGLLCDLCHPPCIFSRSPVRLMGMGSKHCPVLGGSGWGSQGRGTAPSCAGSTNQRVGARAASYGRTGQFQEPITSTIFCLNYCSGPPPGQAGKQSCGRPLPGGTREPADGQTCAEQISLLSGSGCGQERALQWPSLARMPQGICLPLRRVGIRRKQGQAGPVR